MHEKLIINSEIDSSFSNHFASFHNDSYTIINLLKNHLML